MRTIPRIALAAVILFCGISVVLGQGQEQPSSESLEEARKLVTLFQPMVRDMAAELTAKQWPQIEAAAKSKYPSIDDMTLAEMRKELDRIVADKMAEAMNEASPIYARYFTADEMKDITAFYSTHTGAKSLTVMPKAMADIMPVIMNSAKSTDSRVKSSFAAILKQHGY